MNVLSEEYLNWMSEETKKKSIYYPNIDVKDINTNNIVNLYNKIKTYQDNFYAVYRNESDSIVFSYNGINYEIGCLYGPEILYYLKQTNKIAKFDIEDVKRNSTVNYEISNRLMIIKGVISELMNAGIDENTINKQVNIYSRTLKKPIKR